MLNVIKISMVSLINHTACIYVPSATEQDEGIERDHAELSDEHARRLDLLVVNQVRVLKSRQTK